MSSCNVNHPFSCFRNLYKWDKLTELEENTWEKRGGEPLVSDSEQFTAIMSSKSLRWTERERRWRRETKNETTELRDMKIVYCVWRVCVCSGSVLYNNEMLFGIWPWECVQERNINRRLTLKPNKDRWEVRCERQSNLETVIALTHTTSAAVRPFCSLHPPSSEVSLFSGVHLPACAGHLTNAACVQQREAACLSPSFLWEVELGRLSYQALHSMCLKKPDCWL